MLQVEDRFAIRDLIAAYVYGMDTNDIESVTKCFTRDAECFDITGKHWDGKLGGAAGFAKHWLVNPHKRKGQHHFQIIRHEPDGAGFKVISFWALHVWESADKSPVLSKLGQYTHTVTRADGRWLISHMKIEPWIVGDNAR